MLLKIFSVLATGAVGIFAANYAAKADSDIPIVFIALVSIACVIGFFQNLENQQFQKTKNYFFPALLAAFPIGAMGTVFYWILKLYHIL